MTTMTWKHAVFMGGAVVILAACSSATAPEPTASTLEVHKGSASVRTQDPTTTTSPGTTPVPEATTDSDCRSGYSVQIGFVDGGDLGSVGACILH
jgi:hypothetical protein